MVIRSLPLLVAAITAFFLLGILLVWVVMRLLRSNREQLLASGPMTAEQEFVLREAVSLLLLIEVPRFGSDFRQLKFEVVDQASGRVTKLSYDSVRARGAVYGATTMRIPLGHVTVERPGLYLVRVGRLKPGADYSRYRIMFSRPYLRRMVLQIVGVVICAIGMLLSLLLALWQVLPLQQG